jgi:hypothetical protein
MPVCLTFHSSLCIQQTLLCPFHILCHLIDKHLRPGTLHMRSGNVLAGCNGCSPVYNLNGVVCVAVDRELLQANSNTGKHLTQSPFIGVMKCVNISSMVRFIRPVCPSVCGWKAVCGESPLHVQRRFSNLLPECRGEPRVSVGHNMQWQAMQPS